ncbi:syntaxin-8-like [Culicoides brevitarsis]|uniref:syntaxin-8-like n=1 Tax=Culicoides brevitarsis TaxID=469753 RepID=UPI00307C09C9
MTLIPIETDWQTEFESCDRLAVEIHSQIQQRNNELPNSERYQSISAGIRTRLTQFSGEVKELKRKLRESDEELTPAEEERRIRSIEKLESKIIQFNQAFGGVSSVALETVERKELLGRNKYLQEDDEDDDDPIADDREGLLSKKTLQKMKEQNARVLREQDEGLESLSKIISRQKDIATRIYDEVENQSELLDGIGNDMENVDVRMAAETRHITQIVRSPSLCRYYMLLAVLILILVLVIWLK